MKEKTKPQILVVVGLGNPTEETPRGKLAKLRKTQQRSSYAKTRHNAGLETLEVLAEQLGASFSPHKSGCSVARASYQQAPVTLVKTNSFMNTSGENLGKLMRYEKVPASNLLVIHDDLDLPKYTLRWKQGGGEAGHNGLRSISQHLGTKDYQRLRIGIGRPDSVPLSLEPKQPKTVSVIDYVLCQIPPQEYPLYHQCYHKAANLILEWLRPS